MFKYVSGKKFVNHISEIGDSNDINRLGEFGKAFTDRSKSMKITSLIPIVLGSFFIAWGLSRKSDADRLGGMGVAIEDIAENSKASIDNNIKTDDEETK